MRRLALLVALGLLMGCAPRATRPPPPSLESRALGFVCVLPSYDGPPTLDIPWTTETTMHLVFLRGCPVTRQPLLTRPAGAVEVGQESRT